MRLNNSQQPISWKVWRTSVDKVHRESAPELLLAHSEWLLPFALCYPHRVTRELSGVIDAVIGERADLI